VYAQVQAREDDGKVWMTVCWGDWSEDWGDWGVWHNHSAYFLQCYNKY